MATEATELIQILLYVIEGGTALARNDSHELHFCLSLRLGVEELHHIEIRFSKVTTHAQILLISLASGTLADTRHS